MIVACVYTYTKTTAHPQQHRIIGAEALLAALEAYGVDNARIEIEGGSEVPVVDGSALGWMVGIEETGVKEALLGRRDRAKRVWRGGVAVGVHGLSNGETTTSSCNAPHPPHTDGMETIAAGDCHRS